MQEFVNAFTMLVRKLIRAGGSTTDQRMIQLFLQGSGIVAQNGFSDYIKQVKLNRKYTESEDAAVKTALAADNRDKGRNTACNNWDYTGSCSYGDRCKFSHDTEPGCKGTNGYGQGHLHLAKSN